MFNKKHLHQNIPPNGSTFPVNTEKPNVKLNFSFFAPWGEQRERREAKAIEREISEMFVSDGISSVKDLFAGPNRIRKGREVLRQQQNFMFDHKTLFSLNRASNTKSCSRFIFAQ